MIRKTCLSRSRVASSRGEGWDGMGLSVLLKLRLASTSSLTQLGTRSRSIMQKSPSLEPQLQANIKTLLYAVAHTFKSGNMPSFLIDFYFKW